MSTAKLAKIFTTWDKQFMISDKIAVIAITSMN